MVKLYRIWDVGSFMGGRVCLRKNTKEASKAQGILDFLGWVVQSRHQGLLFWFFSLNRMCVLHILSYIQNKEYPRIASYFPSSDSVPYLYRLDHWRILFVQPAVEGRKSQLFINTWCLLFLRLIPLLLDFWGCRVNSSPDVVPLLLGYWVWTSSYLDFSDSQNEKEWQSPSSKAPMTE